MAEEVIRHKDNASDKDLEIVTPLNIANVLDLLTDLQTIVTTGEKATHTLLEQLRHADSALPAPEVGGHIVFSCPNQRTLRLYRMPSSSRAYPLALEKKGILYQQMFAEVGEGWKL
jgi:G:T/U-mismatch repair DNA glycosylase